MESITHVNEIFTSLTPSPADTELMEVVIDAACKYYHITEDDLLNLNRATVNARQICYYIIFSNTQLKEKAIGRRFKKGRTSVQYGVGLIDIHKNIYRQVLGSINGIIDIANNFDKKYQWHLQPINIIH
jgi:chromosomal replication initiation ATPase DnaA